MLYLGDSPCLSSVPTHAGMIVSCLQMIKPPGLPGLPPDFGQPPCSGDKMMVSVPYLCAKETQFRSVVLLPAADKAGPILLMTLFFFIQESPTQWSPRPGKSEEGPGWRMEGRRQLLPGHPATLLPTNQMIRPSAVGSGPPASGTGWVFIGPKKKIRHKKGIF